MAGNPTLPKENIDEVILGLLALEPNEVDELGYQTYSLYLRELLVEVTSGRRKIDGSEVELIKNEFKRVRGKKGRFRIVPKSSKVTANGLGLGGIRKQIKGTQKRLMLAPVGGVPKEKVETLRKKDSDLDVLSRISNTLDSIVKTLTDINKESKNRSDRERKDAESKKRLGREKELESKIFDGIKKVVSTITKPFQSVWDRIVNFIKNIILGRILIKLIDWFADPQNQGKIKSLIRFFKDWWPAILGSYVLFGTTFGRFIRGAVGLVGRFIFQIGRVAIPQLLKFINTPFGKAVALFTAGATIPAMFPGTVNEQERKTSQSPGSTQDKIKQLQQQKANLNVFERLQGKGAEIDEQLEYLKTGKTKAYGFSGGGFNGLVSGPKGRDKVPAMLTDGEFVVSAGAVNKYGVETFEAMNAAGGGTNKPQIVNGTTHAYGGGLVGSKSNTPFSKDPLGAIKRFINYKFGIDIDRPPTWGLPAPKGLGSSGASSGRVSTGSLATDPVGASMRIANQLGIKMPGTPRTSKLGSQAGNLYNRVSSAIQSRLGLGSTKKGKGGFLSDLKSSTYRDAGSIYAKQMLGGFGGPVSERDLSKDSQQELQKAIQRAKKRTGSEIRKVESEIAKLKSMGAKDGNPALERQKSFLSKLKSGGIRVQYTDYADEKGNMSESAKNAKNILGQFWAYERNKKEGGGYRIEDKYDFDAFKKKVKDPKTGKMVERELNQGELVKDVILGKDKTIQQILQAAYLLNLFKGKGDVDMVLGGKRTAAESLGLTASKTMLGGMLGISGKPKDKNTQALEAKRPWWDKMGMFGGASGAMQREMKAKQDFLKKNPSAKLYNKPQKNTGQSYKSRFARPKNAGRPPVKPLPKPKPKTTVAGGGMGGGRGSGARPTNSQKPRTQNPTHSANATRTARSTLGVNKK